MGMGIAELTKKYTPAEYFALEAKAEYKSDYYDGEIFPCGEVGPDGQLISMAGGSRRHSLICSNLIREVGNRLKGNPCRAFESNLRLSVASTGLRAYPDVSIYCGQSETDPSDPSGQTLTNPTVLFEVLSPTTEGYDRGTKTFHYRRIESLRALVMVKQDALQVEVQFRGQNGAWQIQDIAGADAVLSLPDIGVILPLAEIYDGVDFTSEM